MRSNVNDPTFFGEEKVGKVLLKIAPPVMLSLLIQALYNIVDSYFVGKFSDHGLTALSVIFPVQTIIIALAVGTGVGVNTLMAGEYAKKDPTAA
ncbi:MAG TPA: MATE family efflux transporter, partial [Clostridiales bacterium]|nr:MATE family efflux transporter [Clostridiales bacterium]